MNVVKYAPGRKPRLLPGHGISRSKWESSPSLRISSASAAKPLREADLSFVVEILQDRMSIKPCSDRVRPAGEILFDQKPPLCKALSPFAATLTRF